MIDLTWKLFSQTGNIETYLIMKELENEQNPYESQQQDEKNETPIDTRL
ncbi:MULTISPECIES: YqzL family protein [Virgibacillus]|nr:MULTISPECIES: YqzL family protein [Virgibacillus]MBS7429680.1 YqzL family protein [Virgibacillus sp. 19R1-5]MBU8565555.1 YqzL family protein [Virgibacillus pantothenticus]MBU8599853.1 YqzL family protein [Virgibacillus pantothenticus]MBU8634300.1 YqzL family protein [Virgibacillus pantothenticus]MBU8641596.1 YqzL family protein [Virgibacillus pantothenticus]